VEVERFFNVWLGLAGLALVLYFTLGEPEKTHKILQGLSDVNGDFIATLQARPAPVRS
jgi:hypothetical protein